MSTRTYDAAAKYIETVTEDFTNFCGTARGMLTEMKALKVTLEADGSCTARVMNFETMKIDTVENAKAADVRKLAKAHQ